ncbi:zinc finger protein ZAT2 [Cornus florida]|uniref:zinc finger protein ZAT2 n=1 Tax=Cornus florida TaxID=4283 RepID=UPI002899B59E|nr:zinc finger protein ZAT2 [Cornus florida]
MSNPKDNSGDQSSGRGDRQPSPPRTGEHPPPMPQTENPDPQPPHHARAGSLSAAGGTARAEGANVGSGQADGGGEARRPTPPKKRYREGDPGASSSSKSKIKPVDNQPQPQPEPQPQPLPQPQPQPQRVVYKCSECPRVFDREKSLFGHLRSHKDRSWRGAYPPPRFNQEEIDEDMAKVIARLQGRVVSESTSQRREEVAAAPVAETKGGGREEAGLDLNVPAPEEGAEDDQPPSPKREDGQDIDLNRSPPSDT